MGKRGVVYKVQVTCTHQVVITFMSVRKDALHWFCDRISDVRGASEVTGFVTFDDMFGNTVSVDASQVIAILVQVVDDEMELDAIAEKLSRDMGKGVGPDVTAWGR